MESLKLHVIYGSRWSVEGGRVRGAMPAVKVHIHHQRERRAREKGYAIYISRARHTLCARAGALGNTLRYVT